MATTCENPGGLDAQTRRYLMYITSIVPTGKWTNIPVERPTERAGRRERIYKNKSLVAYVARTVSIIKVAKSTSSEASIRINN